MLDSGHLHRRLALYIKTIGQLVRSPNDLPNTPTLGISTIESNISVESAVEDHLHATSDHNNYHDLDLAIFKAGLKTKTDALWPSQQDSSFFAASNFEKDRLFCGWISQSSENINRQII